MPIDVHDSDRLKELQALPLDRKIAITQARIIEWLNFWEGNVYVSYSGGKDSTVLLDLVIKTIKAIDPTFEVPVVFSNTGLEYPEIQRFARSKGATFVTPKMNIVEVIRNYGYPLISKEVSSAIYYARRIKPYTSEGGGRASNTQCTSGENFLESDTTSICRGYKETTFKRLELQDKRPPNRREWGGQDEFRTAIRKRNELLDQRIDSCSPKGYQEKGTHGDYG